MVEIELYTFEDELWYRLADGSNNRLTESSVDIIRMMHDKIETFYPKAHSALVAEYIRCASNIQFYKYRIVKRFCKCNFGNIDNIPDIDKFDRMNFERVSCPIRGECRLESIVCRPEFNTHISDAEMRVLKLWYNGCEKSDIAENLYLSVHTVNNHIRNAFTRLGIHDKAEFFKWATTNKIFTI